MFKFVLQVLAAIITSITLWMIFISLNASRIYSSDYSVMNFRLNITPAIIKNKSILFFGESSIMNAILPSALKQEAYNASVQCGGPFEFYTLIKRLNLDQIKPPFIVLSMHAKKITNQENCFSDMLLMFNLLNISELNSIFQEKTSVSYLGKSSKIDVLLDLILFKVNLHPIQLATIKELNFLKNENSLTQKFVNQSMLMNRGYFKCSAPSEFPFDSPTDSYGSEFTIHDFDLNFLNKFLQVINEKKIRVIYLNPGYSQTYKKLFSTKFLASQDSFFKSIMKKYPLFYYDNEILFLDNSYFQDSVHMNEKGVAVYTKWTQNKLDQLKMKGIIP